MKINDIAPPTGDTFKFAAVGDTVKGVLTYVPEAAEEQVNKFTGAHEKVIKLLLATDDGDRTIWPRVGSPMAQAIGDAVRAAGCDALEIGGTLAVRYSDDKDTGKPQPLKLYTAKYEPPARGVKADDLF